MLSRNLGASTKSLPLQVTEEWFDGNCERKTIVLSSFPATSLICFPGQKSYLAEEIISTDAFLSFMTSPLEFWIQTDAGAVDSMMGSVYNYAETCEIMSLSALEHAYVGQACLAIFPDNEMWYRAAVEALVDEESVSVHYVDYGNSSTVKRIYLREMPSTFLETPPMALKCCLDGADAPKDLVVGPIGPVIHVKTVEDTAYVRLPKDVRSGKDPMKNIPLVLHDPQEDEKEFVVSYMISPVQFWIQLKKDLPTIEDIEEEIKSRDFKPVLPLQSSLQSNLGDMFIVEHPESRGWFRAELLAVQGDATATFFFVDYGDTQTVPLTAVRHCSRLLRRVARMSQECLLSLDSIHAHQLKEELFREYRAMFKGVICRGVFGQCCNGVQKLKSMKVLDLDAAQLLNNLSAPATKLNASIGLESLLNSLKMLNMTGTTTTTHFHHSTTTSTTPTTPNNSRDL